MPIPFIDGLSLVAVVLLVVAVTFVIKAVKVVPQQNAWVVERLGKFHAVLQPGLNIVIPFVDRLAYKHSLKEVPLDTPSQVCITRDNTQLQVDGVLYFQVTDPQRASYGASNYILAITQLAQTTLRSVIGKLELDKTFEEREFINHSVVSAIDEAAMNWGVKVLRYEIKDITPPNAILHAMQAQITAEREKRALIASSEGRKQEQINIATGAREAAIAKSEGDKQAQINVALGEASAIVAIADATAKAMRQVAEAIGQPGGIEAVNLKVAERYVDAFSGLAKTNNTLIVPANLGDIATLISTAMTVVKSPGRRAIGRSRGVLDCRHRRCLALWMIVGARRRHRSDSNEQTIRTREPATVRLLPLTETAWQHPRSRRRLRQLLTAICRFRQWRRRRRLHHRTCRDRLLRS